MVGLWSRCHIHTFCEDCSIALLVAAGKMNGKTRMASMFVRVRHNYKCLIERNRTQVKQTA